MPKFFLPLAFLLFAVNGAIAQKQWTFLYYAAGSNSSEIDLMADVKEMTKGKVSDDYNLILLIDRIEGHSDDSLALGSNFTDTKLFDIDKQGFSELNGSPELSELNPKTSKDLNMGDAHTLKRFIQYGKKNYPAKHYMLILRSHGNGISMCPDTEHGEIDRLYTAEISDVLGQAESVDILGLDVCSMAQFETYYQWRPRNDAFSANYIIASAPLSAAWAYTDIFGRLQNNTSNDSILDSLHFNNGKEFFIAPNSATSLDICDLFFEEIYDSQRWASWALVDNSQTEKIKLSMDSLARFLKYDDKNIVQNCIENSLSYYHNTNNNLEVAQLTFPYADAADFLKLISENEGLSPASRDMAKNTLQIVDAAILQSYYGSGFLPVRNDFKNGVNGVAFILPMGHKTYSASKRSFWAHNTWFNANKREVKYNEYGSYDWCRDGATSNNQNIENFFEYLDYIFDEETVDGGVNGYGY